MPLSPLPPTGKEISGAKRGMKRTGQTGKVEGGLDGRRREWAKSSLFNPQGSK